MKPHSSALLEVKRFYSRLLPKRNHLGLYCWSKALHQVFPQRKALHQVSILNQNNVSSPHRVLKPPSQTSMPKWNRLWHNSVFCSISCVIYCLAFLHQHSLGMYLPCFLYCFICLLHRLVETGTRGTPPGTNSASWFCASRGRVGCFNHCSFAFLSVSKILWL